ncbi:hypothetical protein BDZ45DRAFT_569851, partial [Acephala macrosclerotiorum]
DPRADWINIKLVENTNETFFRINPAASLKKLMETFCERLKKDVNGATFFLDGKRVSATDTVEGLEMEDGETINV